MKKLFTRIGTIIRAGLNIVFVAFCLIIGLSIITSMIPSAALPISQSSAETLRQDSAYPNVTIADYSFSIWIDDDLYTFKSDAQASNVIIPEFESYHNIDPENLVTRLDQDSGDNGVTASFITPYFGYYAQIGSNIDLDSMW